MIHNLIFWIDSSKYFLLFAGTLFEGPVMMVSGGFLYKLGQFELIPMYLCLAAGDFVADICWYFVGYYGGRPIVSRFGRFVGIGEGILEKVEGRFQKYQTWILVISKLTMGFGFAIATLITAGIMKVSFKKYVAINFFGGLIWTTLLILIGYVFGNLYFVVPDEIKIFFVGFILIAAVLGIRKLNSTLVNTEI